ncbi:hypothetical protein N665_0211s0036 [Sinapis alba]|nr:hypothetical protein N665_0211s0036 [Sinapis alba]
MSLRDIKRGNDYTLRLSGPSYIKTSIGEGRDRDKDRDKEKRDMGSSQAQLSQAFIVLLLLCVMFCLAECAIPSHQQPLSVIGRRLMSRQIFTGPSGSGHGGGHTPSP